MASTPATGGSEDQGTARAAVDPIPVPGKPAPIPVPGRGGSGGKPAPIPVPGGPSKGPLPGATPTPAPGTTPTPVPTPAPPTVKLTFNGTGLPATAVGTLPRASSTIKVSGVTGQIRNLTVAWKAAIPNDSDVDEVRVGKQMASSPSLLFASLFSDTNEPKLSGSDMGTNCIPFGGATTSDDQVGGGFISSGLAPYSGVFRTDGTLTALALAARSPADGNGDYIFELLLESGGVGTLECVTLIVEYQP